MEEEMTLEEQKQIAIDNYTNLLRIKSAETGTNRELDRQIEIARIKLSVLAIDHSKIEALF